MSTSLVSASWKLIGKGTIPVVYELDIDSLMSVIVRRSPMSIDNPLLDDRSVPMPIFSWKKAIPRKGFSILIARSLCGVCVTK
ncbi:hypothetical protein ED733_002841 [Metarhizium rileyi]|uniref:Uncharacterized protein n=1 Tax=Metarhizium rileyi (strain RCEF 4871) TaxID=1649241 RepID=A0A5C6GBC2_METRR|nr:hypothetical protein ED733_002841 [Metarhizium rileyi]